MKPIKLYKKDSKSVIRVWTIWTEDNTIYTEHGVLNGKTQIASKNALGKNVGKSNETSASEQAELEAISMSKKKKDKGYGEDLKEVSNPKELRISPMLAHKWDPKKKKLQYPVDVQPKLDGVRCLAHWENGRVVLKSRGGKLYNVPHISNELEQKDFPKNIVLDGELYVHGIPFQLFMRLVKKNRPESVALKFHVYDVVDLNELDQPWSVRKDILDEVFEEDLYECEHTHAVQAGTVFSEEKVFDMQAYYIKEGFEGLIVRLNGGKYRLGHRSRELLKFKNFDDEEFQIVDFQEGVGKAKGSVVWVCETNGAEFSVVPRGTYEQRQDWFTNGQSFVGSQLTVRYFGKSEDKIPRFPVGINIREEGI